VRAKSLNPGRMLVDECMIEHMPGIAFLRLKKGFVQTLERCLVAIDAHLQKLFGQGGFSSQQATDLLGMRKTQKARLA